MSKYPRAISSAAHASASAEANATTRRDAESAASSGTTTSQIAAKDSMPPVRHRDRHDETGERQRRQHVRAFVTAGARQEPRQQNRRDQPGERRDLERGGRAAHREIDRECRKRREAAEQPRRDERAMARARQRVISRRGMQQRIETIADDTQNCHGSRASACSSNRRAGTPPLSLRHRVRANIKRTLRRAGPTVDTPQLCGVFARRGRSFNADGERRVSGAARYGFEMVDAARPRFAAKSGINRKFTANQISRIFRKFSAN